MSLYTIVLKNCDIIEINITVRVYEVSSGSR